MYGRPCSRTECPRGFGGSSNAGGSLLSFRLAVFTCNSSISSTSILYSVTVYLNNSDLLLTVYGCPKKLWLQAWLATSHLVLLDQYSNCVAMEVLKILFIFKIISLAMHTLTYAIFNYFNYNTRCDFSVSVLFTIMLQGIYITWLSKNHENLVVVPWIVLHCWPEIYFFSAYCFPVILC